MDMEIFSEFSSIFAENAEYMSQFRLSYLIRLLMSSMRLIAVYVLQSVGFYSLAKRRGIHHPWLAWIPVGNQWILGSLADQYQYVAKGKVKNRRKILLGLQIATTACAILVFVATGMLGFFSVEAISSGMDIGSEAIGVTLLLLAVYLALLAVSIVLAVFQFIACYDLYASCSPNNAVVFLVLSILINVTMPIFIFAIRNKDGGMPPRRVQPAPPEPETEEFFAQPEEFLE